MSWCHPPSGRAGHKMRDTYNPVIPPVSTSVPTKKCWSEGVREGSHFVIAITRRRPARTLRVDESPDLHDPVGAEAGHLRAPAVEGAPPAVCPEEGGERALLLEGVSPLHPLDRAVRQRHL